PEERVAARRRRIAERLGNKAREEVEEDVEPKVDEKEEEEQRKSHKQVEESRQRLAKLLFEGTQMVTDIQVSADLREIQRRTDEAELKRQRVERLENEAKSSTSKFEEITSKWASAEEIKIPQELWQPLNQQQQHSALLLERKNKLIGDLQQELKNKEEQYVQTIKKQSDDIHLLLERMEEQSRFMLKNFRQHLLQIEEAFEVERRELLDNNKKKWEESIRAHKAKEMEYLQNRMRKVEEYEKQLEQLWVQDEEEYNNMKLLLENDVQNLEKQLQHMKAVYQLNQEKLEFNLQVLKKREEENTIIRSQQKRKINRLYSLLSDLKTKLAKQEKQFREENQSLAAVCKRIREQCKDVQRKTRHFSVSDEKKFVQVWLMNEEEAKGLMRKVLDADRVIHTQQLGLPWEEPQAWFLNNVGPLGYPKAKSMETEVAAEILTVGIGEGGRENAVKAEDRSTPLGSVCKKTARRILDLVKAESVWSCCPQLARPKKAQGNLLHLVLQATLEIDDEDVQNELVDFFLKYKAQELAASQLGAPRGKVALEEEKVVKAPYPACWSSLQSQGSPGGEDVMHLAEDREHGSGGLRKELESPQSLLSSVLSVDIEPDDVLKILKAFMKDFSKLRTPKVKDELVKEVKPVRDSSKDEEYWEALAHILPESTLKLWDALTLALEEYYEVLMHRANLLAEVATLRQQNVELCLLLKEYLTSG
ncbi:Coiled-coil domain-containing protein 164, partial [Chaetura pelagica]